jgi:hypothetical protein
MNIEQTYHGRRGICEKLEFFANTPPDRDISV